MKKTIQNSPAAGEFGRGHHRQGDCGFRETGFGNAPPTAVITGDSQDSIIAAIRDTLGPKILGMDVENLEEILSTLDAGMLHNHSAKAALDIAVHDLFGKRFGMPLYKYFGGYCNRMETDLTISLNGPEEMVRDAKEAVSEGYARHQNQGRKRTGS